MMPLVLGAALVVVLLVAQRRNSPKVIAPLLLLLVILDLGVLGPVENRGTVDPMRDVYQQFDLRYGRLVAHPPGELFRVKVRDYQSGDALIPRNQGMFSGMMLHDGYNPLQLARRLPLSPSSSQMLDLLNVRFDHPDGGKEGALLERPTARGQARILFAVRVFDDDSAAAAAVRQGANLDSVVILDTAPSLAIAGGSGTATITRYDAATIEADVNATAPGILLFSEIWYPAWRADVDGMATPVMRADGALRAVAVPAGTHHVRMVYASGTARTGAAIAGGTLLFAAAGLVLMRIRNIKRMD
jgi:hypothetical protein